MVLIDIPGPVEAASSAAFAAALRLRRVFVFTSCTRPSSARPSHEGPGGQRYRKVTGYLHHQTRWIESFGGHRHYHRAVVRVHRATSKYGMVVTGLHEPPSFPHSDIPETD